MSNKIYLDYQATTPVDEKILKKMIPYFSENFGNPHSNNHEFGRSANSAVDEARANVANLINAETNEIIFTSGATESNNLAIKSIAKNYFEKDCQIITVKTEHKCVLESCHELEKEGFTVTYLDVNEDGIIKLSDLENLLKEKPALVSIMHANNEIGVLQPIKEIGELCKKYNSIFHSDIAQSIGTQKIDVVEMNIDACSISAHKIYGPKGIGALYVSNHIKNTLRPLMSGGGQEMNLRSGTLSPALCVGIGEACKDISQNREKYTKHFEEIKSTLVLELNNSNLDYVVIICAGIVNIRDEWPLSNADLYEYAVNKYGVSGLTDIKYYETKLVKDSSGKVILPKGRKVNQNFKLSYYDNGIVYTNDLTKLGSNVVSLANPVNAISNYEYETIRNEEKRNIFVLKSGFLQQFLDDIKEIMVYDESTQRIDDTTAQTENLNISMP